VAPLLAVALLVRSDPARLVRRPRVR